MDLKAHKDIVRSTWGVELTDAQTQKLAAYFRYWATCHLETASQTTETLFFIEIVKKNCGSTKSALRAAIDEVRRRLSSDGAYAFVDATTVGGVIIPAITAEIRATLLKTNFKTDRAISRAVKIVWAIDLAEGPTAFSGHSVTLHWDDSKSLQKTFEDIFPKQQPPGSLPYLQIRRRRLSARHLCEHADVELEWTQHLPDHLHLDLDHDTKKLRIFELPCLLEATKEFSGTSNGARINALHCGTFEPEFIIETIMTYTLLFPPKDRVPWLKSIITPRRQWPKWWIQGPSLDPRLGAPFDVQIKRLQSPESQKYRRPVLTVSDLYDLYPHWAVRLQYMYEEAEDPTPTSAVGRWAQRKKGPRHTYWITVAAFALAIFFGIASTVVGILQLWISYCQWQVPQGGYGCGG